MLYPNCQKNKVFLLLNTLVYLQVRQFFYQLKNRFFQSDFHLYEFPIVNNTLSFEQSVNKSKSYDGKDNITFLNVPSRFSSWNDTSKGMLWAYNLNYMDWLCQEEIDFKTGAVWIDKFIDELPLNKVGLDPYPIALRGINWIKFICLHKEQVDAKNLERWNTSLYSQYRLLERKLEYHLLGNHLLEDAFSLFIGALYFSDKRLYKKAVRLLYRELDEQILPDGAHYELSPMYHCILLERLLDCYNFSSHNRIFPQQEKTDGFLKEKAVLMLGHLEEVVYSDGSIPLLNDAAYGIAPTASQLFAYARRLDISWEPVLMKECGYRKMANERMELILDVGNVISSYQPGHSHADALNYELRTDGKPFIIDTGISTYDKTERRQYERGTSAHNTVVVDGHDSAEVWGGFRMARRAEVSIVSEEINHVVAKHCGVEKGLGHHRSFKLHSTNMEITDEVHIGHEGISYIHFAPDVRILSCSCNEVDTERGRVIIENAKQVEIFDEKMSCQYNTFNSIKVVAIHFQGRMKYRVEMNKTC